MSHSQQGNKSASVLKSGFIWKKGIGILGNHYKERLFELKLTGKLDYFDISSGKRILKGTILLSASDKIIIRKNLPPDQQKFIIKTKKREWYLWCRGKNGKEQVQQWCIFLKNMINSSKSVSKKQLQNDNSNTKTHTNHNNDQKNDNNNDTNNNNSPIEQTHGSSDELFGDYPTPEEILITRPVDPHTPFNPFYGNSISAASISTNYKNENDNDDTMDMLRMRSNSSNPYYTPMVNNNINNSITDISDIASAPAPIVDNEESKLNEQFENMTVESDSDNGFKIAEIVSLKSALFHTWISYNNEGYLYGVQYSPMVNERFIFKCVDKINNIYTIQTCSNGLYLSATMDGNIHFNKKMYGIYEEWIINYYHINKISITSKYYNTHFGIDSNGLFHHRYPSITTIVQFEVSPPVILNKKQTELVILLNNTMDDKYIKYPIINGLCIAFCCCINGNFIGIENRESNILRTDYTTFQSFDGELLTKSTFKIIKDNNNYRLYAFKCLLNNKYISPNDNINGGNIQFVSELTEKEYFQIIWQDIHIISMIAYNGTILKVKHNMLYNEIYDELKDNNNNCLFEIKSKEFIRLNKDINIIPYCQLPIRSINGQLKRDIWLKGVNIGYLAFRSQPYRYEAVSQIMGRWETIRFQHNLSVLSLKKECIVSLFTENGMIIACDNMAQITYLTKEDKNDMNRCQWFIYFHNYSLISIQNYKYKGWMTLKKSIKQPNIYVLSMINPDFDQNGKPFVDINNAIQFKNIYCQFELCPMANYKQNNNNNNNTKHSAVSFAM